MKLKYSSLGLAVGVVLLLAVAMSFAWGVGWYSGPSGTTITSSGIVFTTIVSNGCAMFTLTMTGDPNSPIAIPQLCTASTTTAASSTSASSTASTTPSGLPVCSYTGQHNCIEMGWIPVWISPNLSIELFWILALILGIVIVAAEVVLFMSKPRRRRK